MYCTYDENDPVMQEQYQKDNFVIINNSIPRKNGGDVLHLFLWKWSLHSQ